MLCRVMRVSTRGYRSWRTRPMSQRARMDMKMLAHIKDQYNLSLGSYGRPRMTMELKEAGLDVGECRVGRLMRINGIRPVRTRRHKVTTNSNHSLGIAPNLLDGNFAADMHYVAVKSAEHQARAVVFRTHQCFCQAVDPADQCPARSSGRVRNCYRPKGPPISRWSLA